MSHLVHELSFKSLNSSALGLYKWSKTFKSSVRLENRIFCLILINLSGLRPPRVAFFSPTNVSGTEDWKQRESFYFGLNQWIQKTFGGGWPREVFTNALSTGRNGDNVRSAFPEWAEMRATETKLGWKVLKLTPGAVWITSCCCSRVLIGPHRSRRFSRWSTPHFKTQTGGEETSELWDHQPLHHPGRVPDSCCLSGLLGTA